MEVSIIDNNKWKDIDTEMFLKVPTSKGEQIFRIKEVVKGIDSIKVYGKHVFFDLENNFILDTNVVQKDGRGAINQILGAMTNNMVNTYYGTSDISIVNNSRLVRKNVVSALIGDADNSFVNRWGGELEVDNFSFSIKQRIGEDRDFQIRYRKNLTGFEGNTNTYNLCTRIVPIGFDGIMLEGTKWIDSKYINNYPQIYTYEIKFDDIKVKENEDDEEGYNTLEEAQIALRQAAENYFISSKCDLPTFSANVNFETLKYTEEYKDLNILERVELGDDINIYIDKIDININARVVKTRYNFFTKKYIEIEIGDVKPNLFKQIANLKNVIDLVTEQLGGNTWQDILDKALDEATKLMAEGLKDSYVITMKNQIVIGDAPDINNMINCIVMNKNGIGFSNNGYLPDRLVSAMTIDGKINASCITTGQLNAALIKTGLLSSANGSTWIDMENGTFNFANKIKFDGSNFEIDLSGKDLATNKSIDSKIEVLQDSINAKVGDTEFKTYKSQTANTISQKVNKGTEFSSEFNQNAEGFNFSIGSTRMNVCINKNNLKVKNGAIEVKNANGTVTIDGSKQMFRLRTWGNGSIVLASGATTKQVTIKHGLGYSPVFKGQFRFKNSSGTIETYENNMALLNWSTGTVNISGRIWVDDTNIYIAIWRSSSAASSGQQTFYYRYFIEEGVNL